MSTMSFTEYQRENYDQQVTIKMTQSMLKDIEDLSRSYNKNISEVLRFIIYLGLKSIKEY